MQSAEILWIGGAALIAGNLSLDLIDLFVLALGVTWLVLQPELRAVLFLTTFQVVMLGLNGRDLLAADFDVLGHQALAVHIAWRAAAIGLAWKGYFTSPSTPASAC